MRREKLIVVNSSRDDEYHSQINNKEVPHGACNVTAYVMSGKQVWGVMDYEKWEIRAISV